MATALAAAGAARAERSGTASLIIKKEAARARAA